MGPTNILNELKGPNMNQGEIKAATVEVVSITAETPQPHHLERSGGHHHPSLTSAPFLCLFLCNLSIILHHLFYSLSLSLGTHFYLLYILKLVSK